MISIDEPKTILNPKSGYVIKTRIQSGGDKPPSTKVFLNVCSNENVPLPHHHNHQFEPEIIYPLIMNNQWEIPIIVSDEREDTDNKGASSLVYDCFINDKCLVWVQLHKELKEIVNEWCCESVELRFGVVLSRDLKLPKLSYKGQLTPLEVVSSDLKRVDVLKKEIEKFVEFDEGNKPSIELLDGGERSMNVEKNGRKLIEVIEGDIKLPSSNQKVDPEKEKVTSEKEKIISIKTSSKTSNKTQNKPKQNLEKLRYSLQYKPLTGSPYKLLITLNSQLQSKDQYQIVYNAKTRSFIVTTTCSDYISSPFEVVVPTSLSGNNFEIVFDDSKAELLILID